MLDEEDVHPSPSCRPIDLKMFDWHEFTIQAQKVEIDALTNELEHTRQLLKEAMERHELIFGGIDCLRLPSQIRYETSISLATQGTFMTDMINGALK